MTGAEVPAAAAAGGATALGGLSAAQWAALAASVLGTGASYAAQSQAADQRRDILNRQLERTDKATDQATKLVADEGKNYAGDDRAAALAAQEAATTAQQTKDLGSAPTIIDTAGDAGAVSNDFLTAKADKAISEGTRLTGIAKELAKTRAPGQLRQTEGLRRANLSGELQSMFGSNHNEANAAGMAADAVGTPAYGALGGLASAAGGAYLAGSNFGGAAGRPDYGLTTATNSPAGLNTPNPGFWNTAGSRIRFGG